PAFSTAGRGERRDEPLDQGLAALAATAARHAADSLDAFREALIADQPGDGHDDMAVLIVRTPDSLHA
ncbi:hypothetical protein AB8B12_21550, partial [Streptomyces sp. PGLac3x]